MNDQSPSIVRWSTSFVRLCLSVGITPNSMQVLIATNSPNLRNW